MTGLKDKMEHALPPEKPPVPLSKMFEGKVVTHAPALPKLPEAGGAIFSYRNPGDKSFSAVQWNKMDDAGNIRRQIETRVMGERGTITSERIAGGGVLHERSRTYRDRDGQIIETHTTLETDSKTGQPKLAKVTDEKGAFNGTTMFIRDAKGRTLMVGTQLKDGKPVHGWELSKGRDTLGSGVGMPRMDDPALQGFLENPANRAELMRLQGRNEEVLANPGASKTATPLAAFPLDPKSYDALRAPAVPDAKAPTKAPATKPASPDR